MNNWCPFITNIKLSLASPPAFRYMHRTILYLSLILIQLPFHWAELILFNKKIRQRQLVKAPIFILGHWRSGTTTIQRFLCAHNNLSFLNQYHAFLPLGSSIHQYLFKPVISQIFKIFKLKHPSHSVPMSVEFPSEEDIAFCMGGFQETPMWGHIYSKNALSFFNKYLILKHGSEARTQFLTKYKYIIKRLSYIHHCYQ